MPGWKNEHWQVRAQRKRYVKRLTQAVLAGEWSEAAAQQTLADEAARRGHEWRSLSVDILWHIDEGTSACR